MSPLHPQDHDLARRLLDGDDEACRELFDRQVPRLYRIVLGRLGGDEDAAEEIVQGTLVHALDRLASYRGEASLLTWLTTLALRRVASLERHPERRRVRVSISAEEGIVAVLDALETAERPEERALRHEVGRLVWATLDRLPPHYADVLRWKYVEDLSMAEIGDRLETGTVAVQSLLGRARKAFRDGFTTVAAALEAS